MLNLNNQCQNSTHDGIVRRVLSFSLLPHQWSLAWCQSKDMLIGMVLVPQCTKSQHVHHNGKENHTEKIKLISLPFCLLNGSSSWSMAPLDKFLVTTLKWLMVELRMWMRDICSLCSVIIDHEGCYINSLQLNDKHSHRKNSDYEFMRTACTICLHRAVLTTKWCRQYSAWYMIYTRLYIVHHAVCNSWYALLMAKARN